jgi:hypothetical protein
MAATHSERSNTMSHLSDLLELPGAAIETEEDFDAIDGCGSSAGGRWASDRATDSGARRAHARMV